MRGWVAQLVEQRIENPRVGGSIPSPATTTFVGRGLTICPEGWVAQLVEQRIENPRVGGSIPSPATILQEADCEDGLLFLYPQFPLPSARTAKTDAPPGHVRSLKDSSPIVSPSSVAISLPALCAKLTGRTRSAAVAPLMNVLMIAQIAGVRVKTDQVDQFPATKRFR